MSDETNVAARKFNRFTGSTRRRWKGVGRSGDDARGSARKAVAETMESRVLLSAYSLNTVASFDPFPQGSQPNGPLTLDSAGNLYGTAPHGGPNNDGTVFEIAAGSNTVTLIASFNGTNGALPGGAPNGALSNNALVLDSSGNLYGTTSSGGSGGMGTVFEIAHGTTTITTLASFNGTNGSYPNGVVVDSSGNLFGTTESGGSSNYGTVFEIAHGTSTLTTLDNFTATNGANPYAPPVLDANGDLFGTTLIDASQGRGTVYEIAHGTTNITTVAMFNGTNGANPNGGLVLDSAGNLYGATLYGGSNNDGTIFEIPKGTTTINALVSFDPTEGAGPQTTLAIDASGNLFGSTTQHSPNPATIFELAHGATAITTLASSASFNYNGGGLTVDSNDDLFGAAVNANLNPPGAVFEIAHGSTTPTTVATFLRAAENPTSLIQDSNGDLFGTTGSSSDYGTVFEIPAGTNALTTIASFDGANGADPQALVIDSAGNLFGVTAMGGTSNVGEFFEIAHGTTSIIPLISFSGYDTWQPNSLLIGPDGNFYGASAAPPTGSGGVFEINRGTLNFTTLASFNGTNGAYPTSLVRDSYGDLFGTTLSGGSGGYGTVFEIVQGTSVVTTLVSFGNGPAGGPPSNGLFLDSKGDLFGQTTEGAGFGDGAVFEIAAGSDTATVLATFNIPGSTGIGGQGNVVVDASGNILGTTEFGGAKNEGTIFEVAAGSGVISTLVSFDGANGALPYAGLLLGSGGNLYGTTTTGGSANAGEVFVLSPSQQPLSVTTQPANQSVTTGQTATFTAAATGTPTPAVQWQVSSDGGATFSNIAGATSTTYSFTASATQNGYEFEAVFTNSQGSATTTPATLTVSSASSSLTIFGTTAPAANQQNINDPSIPGQGGVEVGEKFTSDVAGIVTGLRFFKGSLDAGTHTGELWTSTGTLLATATFTNETASGWQQVTLSNPVNIAANTTYVVSYHTTAPYIAYTPYALAGSGVDNAPLHLLANGVSGGDGVYAYGASSFPANYNGQAPNYWADVVFSPSQQGTQPAAITAQPVAQTVAAGQTVTFTAGASGVPYPYIVWQVSTDGVNFVNIPGATSTSYSFTATAAQNGSYFRIIANNSTGAVASQAAKLTVTSSSSSLSVFGTTGPAANQQNIADPTIPSSGGVELGSKFTSTEAGQITGVRFFKGASDNGSETAELWDSSGNLLASAPFTNETASGWQSVTFASPVNIAANTTYIVSYHTTSGTIAYSANGLASTITNGPLSLLGEGVNGNDGVYKYGPSSFPTNYNGQAPNYWVDVNFSPTTVSTPQTIFGSSTPAANYQNVNDPGITSSGGVTLGTEFTSDVNASVTGVRFFKGSLDTGTHTGQLWSSTGQLLAQVTFTNETASGWQEADFSTPVSILANTTYIVSYNTTAPYIAYTPGGFASGANSGTLHALSTVVYHYDTTPGTAVFPNLVNGQQPNYWVDVVVQ